MIWYTEHHNSSAIIVCEVHGLKWWYLLKDENMKTAHDPDFLFWQAIGAITRSVREYGKYLEGGTNGLRRVGDVYERVGVSQ